MSYPGKAHAVQHNSYGITDRLHMLHSLDEVSQTLHAYPEGFDAGWFAVAFSAEEAAEHGDLADDFANRWCDLGGGLFRQNISIFPLGLAEERAGFLVGMGSTQLGQTGQQPGNRQIDGQCHFLLGDAAQLQCFNPATILEYMKEGLGLLAAAIPVDQLDYGDKAFCRPVGQQTPFHRFAVCRGTDLSGDQTGNRQLTSPAIRQADRACPKLLPDFPRRLPLVRSQGEFDLPQRRTGKNTCPQFAAVRQPTVVLRADQPVSRCTLSVRALHQFEDVGFPVSDINEVGVGLFLARLGNPLIALDPVPAFENAGALDILSLGFLSPYPGFVTPSGSRSGVTTYVGRRYMLHCASWESVQSAMPEYHANPAPASGRSTARKIGTPPAFPTSHHTPRECWPSACRQSLLPVSPAVDSSAHHPMLLRQTLPSPTPSSLSLDRKDSSKAMGVPDCCGQPQNRQEKSPEQTMRLELCGVACVKRVERGKAPKFHVQRSKIVYFSLSILQSA